MDDWRNIDAKDYNAWSKVWQTYFFNEWNRSGNSDYRVVSSYTLRDMGWLPSTAVTKAKVTKADDSVIEKYGAVYGASDMTVEFKRYTKPGYSNIPLHLVHAKAVEKGIPFDSIPSSYAVSPGLLSTLHGRWKGMLSSTGRRFIAISTDEYRSLRATYLHYSANSSFGGNLVNGHETVAFDGNNKIITRRIYRGLSDVHSHYYLHNIAATTVPSAPAKRFTNH